jgi:hypothetical protein
MRLQTLQCVGILNAHAASDCAGVEAGERSMMDRLPEPQGKEGVPSPTKYRNGVRFHEKMTSILRACHCMRNCNRDGANTVGVRSG